MSVCTYYNWTAHQYRPLKLQLQLLLLLFCVSHHLEMYIIVSLYLLHLNSWPVPTSKSTFTAIHTKLFCQNLYVFPTMIACSNGPHPRCQSKASSSSNRRAQGRRCVGIPSYNSITLSDKLRPQILVRSFAILSWPLSAGCPHERLNGSRIWQTIVVRDNMKQSVNYSFIGASVTALFLHY